MVAKVCPKCNSSDIDSDGARGEAVCTNCGHVLEECAIVSEVQFSENAGGQSSVVGQFVPESGVSSFRCGPGYGGFGKDSRELTLANGKRLIQHIAQVMHLGNDHIEVAHRFFQQAVQRNFIQGRKTHNVVAVCLYITCRFRKTSHMLIDFAENLQTDVYELGSVFLKFCKLQCIKLDPIDPSLYIHRFAGSLEFGDKTNAVATTAIRVVANMNREWMTTGRRPAGICGAGLLIAAKMHRFHRTEAQVAQVVRICDGTLKKRLNEFDETSASEMTVQQFNSLFKTGSVSDFADASAAKKEQENWAFTNSRQPPALKQQEKKRKQMAEAAQRRAEEGDVDDSSLEALSNQARKILQDSKTLRELDDDHEAGAQNAAAHQAKMAALKEASAKAAAAAAAAAASSASAEDASAEAAGASALGGHAGASSASKNVVADGASGNTASAANAGAGRESLKEKEMDSTASASTKGGSPARSTTAERALVVELPSQRPQRPRRVREDGQWDDEEEEEDMVREAQREQEEAEEDAAANAREENERLSDVDDDEIGVAVCMYVRSRVHAVVVHASVVQHAPRPKTFEICRARQNRLCARAFVVACLRRSDSIQQLTFRTRIRVIHPHDGGGEPTRDYVERAKQRLYRKTGREATH
jgi:transcription initiation factor TFIIIB Brf1 subunit/transcription initiation factor TFIIB